LHVEAAVMSQSLHAGKLSSYQSAHHQPPNSRLGARTRPAPSVLGKYSAPYLLLGPEDCWRPQ
jgi:hypothetical protein